jgi:hypothetical protein
MTIPNEISEELLLTNDPFQNVYGVYKDKRDLFIPYTGYRDTLYFARIIVRRIFEDIEKSKLRIDQLFQVSRQLAEQNLGKPVKTSLSWEPIYELELDLESLVIFSKILLDKFAVLIETIFERGSPENYLKSFTKHKEWYVNYEKNEIKKNGDPLFIKYSSLLADLHWYDQNLQLLRNNIIIHRGSKLVGSLRTTQKGAQYRRIPKDFGFLKDDEEDQDRQVSEPEKENKDKDQNSVNTEVTDDQNKANKHQDKSRVEQMIQDYGKINKDIMEIQLNPATMLDEFVQAVFEHNIELKEDDLKDLEQIISRNGGRIDALVLYKQVCKFLSNVASILVE